MKKFLTAFALLALTLSACAPSADRPSLKPVLIKLDRAVSPGEVLAIQGRYLGGPQNSQVVFNADDVGAPWRENAFLLSRTHIGVNLARCMHSGAGHHDAGS